MTPRTDTAPTDWLTPREVMAFLKISRSAVFRMQKLVPHVRIPGGIRFKLSDVLAFLDSSMRHPEESAHRSCRGGTRNASADDEVLPGGKTRGELKRAVGF